MSLKALARERLAIIRGDTPADRECFTGPKQSSPVKQLEWRKTAEKGECFMVSPLRAANSETAAAAELIDKGLADLAGMLPPKLRNPKAWERVRADAFRLRSDGWVDNALSLGWEPLHLFGCSPDPGGNCDHDGLAVALAGRKVLLLDATSAVIEAAPGSYSVFNVRQMAGAVLLWDLAARTT